MDVGKLFVSLGLNVEEFERNLNTASKKMEDFGKRMNKVGKDLSMKVTAPLTALGGAAVYAFTIQEGAENRLRAALVANGREVDSLYNQYKEFATEMQRLTVVGDESTLKMIQQAESMGITGDAAMRAAKNAIALAAAQGMSAESAIRYTAALEQGDATMLKRYLPTLRSVEDESQMAAKAQELLANMFQVAEAEAKTAGGQMVQMKNAVGDLMEQFGAIIAEAILPFINRIKELAERFQGLDDRQKRLIVTVAAIAAAVGPVLIVIGQMSIGLAAVSKAMLFMSSRAIPAMANALRVLAANPAVLAITGLTVVIAALIVKTKASTLAQNAHTAALNKQKTAAENLAAELRTISTMRDEDAKKLIQQAKTRLKQIDEEITMMEMLSDAENTDERQKRVEQLKARQKELFDQMANGVNVGMELAQVNRALDEAMATASSTTTGYEENLTALREEKIALTSEIEAAEASLSGMNSTTVEATESADGLKTSLESLAEEVDALSDATERGRLAGKAYSDMLDNELAASMQRLADIDIPADPFAGSLDTMDANVKKHMQLKSAAEQSAAAVSQGAQQIGQAVGEFIGNVAFDAFQRLGAALGGAKGAFKGFGKGVLEALLKLGQQIGKIAMGIGAALLAIQTQAINPVAIIVAGAALAGLTAALSGVLSRGLDVPEFANGGIVSGPTLGLMGEYAGARSNPEVIAPLNKLQSMIGGTGGEVTFRIEGRELVGILSREGSLAKRV